MQELATIMHHKIPIKIFVINNNGYMTIRNTADKFFEGRYIGTDSSCGISFPNLDSIANAYQIDYEYVKDNYFLEDNIKMCLESDKAMIMEIICCPVQKLLASY
jgi:acetolactate synthase-1/2/3 large subunit